MKFIYKFFFFFFLLFPGISIAQQQGQFSQYMQNYYLVNPAISGTEDFAEIKAGYRAQWIGVDGSPRNYYFGAITPINKVDKKRNKKAASNPHHAAGLLVSGQTYGAISHNGIYASYAYHLPVSDQFTVSMALSPGIKFYYLNRGMLNFGDDVYDEATSSFSQQKLDMNAGAFLYSDKLFIGISSMQLFKNKLNFSKDAFPTVGYLNRHYYLTGGYKFQIDRDLAIIPSLLVKTLLPTAYQVDINCKVRYKDFLWGGLSYRHKDAVAALVGVLINNNIEIGYSYDYTISGLTAFSKGSHEIMLGLRLPRSKTKIICPNEFW